MKVSVNELKKYTNIDLSVDELVRKIGAQLGGVDRVTDIGKKYQGIVVARVISCRKHHDADKLQTCTIDDGGNTPDVSRDENGYVQVVCGAPNVAEGILVAWLPPGVTVPATYDKDPLVLEARDIRGQMSNGMLASSAELGLSDDHSGILEIGLEEFIGRTPENEFAHKDALKHHKISQSINPGDNFAKLYGLDDYIIDIENKMFTHRPDLFGTLGIAREIAGIQQKSFESPYWYKSGKTTGEHGDDKDLLTIRNELPELVPRFVAQVVQNVTVGPGPLWLQIYLTKIGMKPISNIVDATNYMMHLTGQPLHAYDYDKVKARSSGEATIVIRYPKSGEKIKLLNGKELEPRPEAIMIATDKELIGVGGVMGGADTEVDDNTTNIILECANFDMYSIRRTSMTHGLFTDAVTRFTKGQSPHQNESVLACAINHIVCETGGTPARSIYDVKGNLPPTSEIRTGTDFINNRLGLNLDAGNVSELLMNVEFEIERNGLSVTALPPFWRTDIEISEDIVEEVGRLYGYDHLSLDLPKRNIVPVGQDTLLRFKQQLRSKLAALGANEVLNYSFVHGNLLDKVGQDRDLAYKIINALSPDLQYYRMSLTPGLLDKVHINIKAGYAEFGLFEMGKTHIKAVVDDEGLPREFERLAFVYAADVKVDKKSSAYYQAKAYLMQIACMETIPFDEKLLNDFPALMQMIAPYDTERSALIWNGNMPVGIVGEFRRDLSRKLKLPVNSAGFEVFISAVQKFFLQPIYQTLSRFPGVSQDICLQVPANMSYAKLAHEFDAVLTSNLGDQEVVEWEPIDIYASDVLKDQKRITYRVTLTSKVRTLTDAVLSDILDKVTAVLQSSVGANRV